jgi:hypothetical protein
MIKVTAIPKKPDGWWTYEWIGTNVATGEHVIRFFANQSSYFFTAASDRDPGQFMGWANPTEINGKPYITNNIPSNMFEMKRVYQQADGNWYTYDGNRI